MAFTGTVLALDLASVTGWAFGKPGTVPKFGTHRFVKSGEPRAAAYRQFRLWLDLFCSAHKTNLVVFESPALPMVMHGKTNINTIKMLMGFAEHLEEWCYNRVELREATVAQVRAHFLGSNMKSAIAKPRTVQQCRDLGWMVDTTDEADACALWSYQCGYLRPDVAVGQTPLFRNSK
jgi:hypothetical protein